MSEDEIRDLKRKQKAEVLLEIDDLDGTILCLRKALVRLQEDKVQGIQTAINRRLNPGLSEKMAPAMVEGILTDSALDFEVNWATLGDELERTLAAYSRTMIRLHELQQERARL